MNMFKKIALALIAVTALLIIVVSVFVGSFKSTLKRCEIWMEDIASGASERLTDSGYNTQPAFSKDGDTIVYIHRDASPDKSAVSDIMKLSLKEGGSATLLSNGRYNYSPSCASDPDRIYYLSRQDKKSDIWMLRVADGVTERLSNDGLDKSDLSVSPDGKWLLYLKAEKSGGLDDVYLMPSSGGEETRLTVTSNFLYTPKRPSWAPDSQEILCVSFISLAVIDIDGKVTGRIDLPGLNNVSELFCGPGDGDTVFFQARPSESAAFDCYLYTVSRKTGDVKMVRKATLAESDYSVSPAGNKVVYSKPYKGK